MLILERAEGDAITIGEELELIVLGVRGSEILFGVNAPKNIAAHRTEIFRRILEESGVKARPGGAASSIS